jgi:hypothetical protein
MKTLMSMTQRKRYRDLVTLLLCAAIVVSILLSWYRKDSLHSKEVEMEKIEEEDKAGFVTAVDKYGTTILEAENRAGTEALVTNSSPLERDVVKLLDADVAVFLYTWDLLSQPLNFSLGGRGIYKGEKLIAFKGKILRTLRHSC